MANPVCEAFEAVCKSLVTDLGVNPKPTLVMWIVHMKDAYPNEGAWFEAALHDVVLARAPLPEFINALIAKGMLAGTQTEFVTMFLRSSLVSCEFLRGEFFQKGSPHPPVPAGVKLMGPGRFKDWVQRRTENARKHLRMYVHSILFLLYMCVITVDRFLVLIEPFMEGDRYSQETIASLRYFVSKMEFVGEKGERA